MSKLAIGGILDVQSHGFFASVAVLSSAKERVMALIDSEHKDVQRQALQCVSKIMVNKWEFVR